MAQRGKWGPRTGVCDSHPRLHLQKDDHSRSLKRMPERLGEGNLVYDVSPLSNLTQSFTIPDRTTAIATPLIGNASAAPATSKIRSSTLSVTQRPPNNSAAMRYGFLGHGPGGITTHGKGLGSALKDVIDTQRE